jgi:hypothetical protein|nr:MAG TPA: hypothetical protein [Caudoviricetes sp.]
MIKVIKTNAAMLKEFPILKDTLLYTIDTKETYFDLNNTERMQIKTGIQYRDENQIFAAINPSPNKIFISKKTNKIYRRSDKRFEEITNRSQLVDLLISVKEMKPVVLTEMGTNIAPRTLMSQVFGEDGRTLEEIIKARGLDRYTFIFRKYVTLEAEQDHQKVFDIPFPIEGYDIKKFPIDVIFGNNEWVTPDNFAISKEQMVFGDVFAARILKGNLITLIFYYTESIPFGEHINAHTINGRYVVFSEEEPMEAKPGDIWFNLTEKLGLEKTATGWKDILNPEDIDVITSNIRVASGVMEVPINLDFNKEKDAIEVYRNGVYYAEKLDYTVSEDSRTITLLEPDIFVIPNEMHEYVFKVTKNAIPRKIKSIEIETP